MTDQFPSNDDIELRRLYFSKNSDLIDFVGEFMGALDAVHCAWLDSSGSFSEPLERLWLAKCKIMKATHTQITPPVGQTGKQFAAGLFDLIEEGWHLCRFVRSFRPDTNLKDADSKRLQSEMLSRLPAIRDELRKAWLHLKHVLLLETSTGSESNGESAFIAAKTQRGKRMTIDQRMKLVLFEKPESSGWSITEFETELKCSRGGIHKTASWKALEAARKLGKAERRNDRRAKTR